MRHDQGICPHLKGELKSLSENCEGCCFRAKGLMASGADHRPRRGRIPFMGLRPRSNEASRPFARKPFRRRHLGYGGQDGGQAGRRRWGETRRAQNVMVSS